MERSPEISADQRLANLSVKLDRTHQTWITTLLGDLEDPVVEDLTKGQDRSKVRIVLDVDVEKARPS